MIRTLRGRLSRRRAQAQFHRILRHADPRLRPELSATAARQQRPTKGTGNYPAPDPRQQYPSSCSAPLRTTEATTGRRTLAGVLAAALAILILLATGTPAIAISPSVARNHHLTLTIDDHVMEFNPEGADFSANSSGTIDTTVFRAGAANPATFGTVSLPTANAMSSRTEFTVAESDSSGMISVKTLSGSSGEPYPIASTTLTVDLLPNHWRSFRIDTDDGHYSCSDDLVTITTVVS